MHTSCSTCPSRGLTSGYFFFFSPKRLVQGGPQFPKNLNWRKIRQRTDKEQKNKRQVNSSQWHTEDVCKISRSESKKRLGHSPGNNFVFLRESACIILRSIWYHADPLDQWKRVTWQFFYDFPGLSLGAKLATDQRQAFNFCNNNYALSERG